MVDHAAVTFFGGARLEAFLAPFVLEPEMIVPVFFFGRQVTVVAFALVFDVEQVEQTVFDLENALGVAFGTLRFQIGVSAVEIFAVEQAFPAAYFTRTGFASGSCPPHISEYEDSILIVTVLRLFKPEQITVGYRITLTVS